jgi:hypothetical protein
MNEHHENHDGDLVFLARLQAWDRRSRVQAPRIARSVGAFAGLAGGSQGAVSEELGRMEGVGEAGGGRLTPRRRVRFHDRATIVGGLALQVWGWLRKVGFGQRSVEQCPASSHSRSHACLDWPRILDRTRATPAASVATTAVLPFLQTADVRAMRTALPSAHSRRARHESTALLSPSFDGAERAHELRLELQIATRHANRERLPSRARPRWPIADHPGEIAPAPIKDHCYPPSTVAQRGRSNTNRAGTRCRATQRRIVFSRSVAVAQLQRIGQSFQHLCLA